MYNKNENGMKIFGIVIIFIGFIIALIYGNVYKSVSLSYLADNMRNAELYPLSEATHEFNLVGFFTITLSSFLCGALFYCLGCIVLAQEKTTNEIALLRKAIIEKSNENMKNDEHLDSSQNNEDEKESHRWRDNDGNMISQ